MTHAFDTCPSRCHSLLIVDSRTQKILLATKEICTLLGYLPSQLIGHSLSLLNLQQLDEHHLVFRHESSHSRVAFKVCIHHEPTLLVDCWCLHTVSPALQWNRGKMDIPSNNNLLRLDSRGVIEYSTENKDSMVGQSLQSLIHPDDRQRLVDGLNEQRQTTYQVLRLRLQDLNDDGSHQWISLTMRTVPKRRSFGAHYDDSSTRQLVIIRPTATDYSSPLHHWSLRGLRIMFAFCLGVALEVWLTTWDTVYQGQRYLVEFLAHLLISLLDFMADCIDPAPSSTSLVRVIGPEEEKQVPWTRPLHRKRWATAVRTCRLRLQSNTMAQKSLGVLETIGVVQSSNMFDYLEKVTSNQPPPPIKNKLC